MSDHPLTFAESVRNPRETGPREIRRKGNVFVDSNAYFRLSIDSLLHTENVPWSTFSSTTLSQEMCCFFLDDGIDREIALVPAFSLCRWLPSFLFAMVVLVFFHRVMFFLLLIVCGQMVLFRRACLNLRLVIDHSRVCGYEGSDPIYVGRKPKRKSLRKEKSLYPYYLRAVPGIS